MRKKFVLPAALAAVGALLLIVAAFAGTGSATASAGKSAAKKGGTLRINMSNNDIDYTDPGLAYDTLSWSMLYTAQVLLVNYPEKNGQAGGQLYPEGATAFPTVSKDGKTYTFTVRQGLKFSDGSPVTAAAFAAGDRADPEPEDGLAGRRQHPAAGRDRRRRRTSWTARPSTIAGVSAKGQTLAIKLTKPNPTFVAIMAMQWFGAVKPNTPYSEAGVNDACRSAGPYYIKSRDTGRTLVEVRNPYYKGTRPANPDQIVWTANTDSDQSLLQVKAGQADIDAHGPPPTPNAALGDAVRRQQEAVLRRPDLVRPLLGHEHVAGAVQQPRSAQGGRTGRSTGRPRPSARQVRRQRYRPDPRPGRAWVTRTYHLYAIKGADPAKAKKVGGADLTGNGDDLPLDDSGAANIGPDRRSTT